MLATQEEEHYQQQEEWTPDDAMNECDGLIQSARFCRTRSALVMEHNVCDEFRMPRSRRRICPVRVRSGWSSPCTRAILEMGYPKLGWKKKVGWQDTRVPRFHLMTKVAEPQAMCSVAADAAKKCYRLVEAAAN